MKIVLPMLHRCLFGYAPASVTAWSRALEAAHQQAANDLRAQMCMARARGGRLHRELHRLEQDYASGELAIQAALRSTWLDRVLVATVGGTGDALAAAAGAASLGAVDGDFQRAEAELERLARLQSQLAAELGRFVSRAHRAVAADDQRTHPDDSVRGTPHCPPGHMHNTDPARMEAAKGDHP